MPTLIQELRNPPVIQFISELKSMGFDDTEIARQVKEKFNTKVSYKIIARMLKTLTIRSKEIIHTDKEVSDLYKAILKGIINESRKNIKVIQETNQILLTKLRESESEKPFYNKELNMNIRTQNDSIRTMNTLLQRLENQAKEITISTVKSVQMTLDNLKNLEDQGFIQIQPLYYQRTNHYKKEDYKKMNEEPIPVDVPSKSTEPIDESKDESKAEEEEKQPDVPDEQPTIDDKAIDDKVEEPERPDEPEGN